MSLNRVVLVGRLTRDPDLRYTGNGTAVANFNVAVNRPFTNQETGEREADFINCVVWRRPAENLANYMKKGGLIGVDGRIQTRSFENKEGQTVYVTEVVADSVQFLESKNNTQSGTEEPSKPKQHNTKSTYEKNEQPKSWQEPHDPFKDSGEPIDINDDELPF